MNHHYPDNYHGYGHNGSGMQGMAGYGAGYRDPTAMARMGQPRENYPMGHYPMMQQSGGMYNQGGFIGQQRGNPYSMGGYGNFGMMGMNQSMMMGARPNDMNRTSGGNMTNPYYNPNMSSDPHSSAQHASMSNQPQNYGPSPGSSHMQQAHMGMMASQSNQSSVNAVPGQSPGQSSRAGQAMQGQNAQQTHNSGPQMPQVGPSQSGQAYGGQSSPHMMPRGHHVPQHPMRHPTTQQNPQEVADNILQMASAYPSNQTVQVPLKSRPAPYHIPRSPHYNVPHTEMPHTSPNPVQQPQQQSPVNCQAVPSPSSSSVKSPTPVLAPIPNPIPSPGISGLRSPCNQGMSPCRTQRSPAHMGSTYSGHSQGGPPAQCGNDGSQAHHGVSPSEVQHYSPCSMTAHSFPPFSASPSTQRNPTMYSPSIDNSCIPNSEQLHQSNYSSPTTSSPCPNNLSSYTNTSQHNVSHAANSQPSASTAHNMGNNPLMSLQKLVMLPETQVVDPKSVVNDACLSSQQDEGPKNVDGPAERLAEGSSHSVGCQGQSSSYGNHPENASCIYQASENHRNQNHSGMAHAETSGAPCYASTQDKCISPHSDSVNQGYETNVDHKDNFLEESGEASQHDDVSNKDRQSSALPRSLQPDAMNTNDILEVNSSANGQSIEPEISSQQIDSVPLQSIEPSIPMGANSAEVPNSDKSNLVDSELEDSLSVNVGGSHSGQDSINEIVALTTEDSDKKPELDGNFPLHSTDRKNGKVKEDPKHLAQCHSPNVLSEVPVVANGLTSAACGNDDDLELDCGNGVHTKIQNAFSSLVKTKLACAKRTSQFACVTPCSIAVGADERAACDRFTFRRNGFCRSVRASRPLLNGRNRSDSTGNADSDESLENVSEKSFGLSESPQDGNRKRTSSAAKRNDHKKPNLNSVSASSNITKGDSKSPKPAASSSNGCVSYNNDEGSDDEMCYYEGVDNSDIFTNNCSSDESITSSGEVKQNVKLNDTAERNGEENSAQLSSGSKVGHKRENVKNNDLCIASTPHKKDQSNGDPICTDLSSSSTGNEKQQSNCSPLSPPSKRLRRSSGQKAQEKLKSVSQTRKISEEQSENIVNLIDETAEVGRAAAAPLKLEHHVDSASQDGNVTEQVRKSNRFRPSILGHKSAGKYPVVVLEKSSVANPELSVKQEKVENSDLAENSTPQENLEAVFASRENEAAHNMTGFEQKIKVLGGDISVKCEAVEHGEKDIKDSVGSAEGMDTKDFNTPSAAPAHRLPKKKPHRRKNMKSKSKGKVSGKVSKNAELKDSFKSMKFSRTLDLMKANRKRERTSLGPFVRVMGKQSTPDSVVLFNQPVLESSAFSSSGKQKHSKNKSHSLPAVTTIHMVTNLPTDKTAMVSSSKTISPNPWVCVFCGHHSSYRFLGDLYGPYFKENEIARVESIAQAESKKGDSSKDQKLSDSGTPSRRLRGTSSEEKKSSRKGKLSSPSRSSASSPPLPEEVWVHEDCAMWSPGVYLVGNKMYGLDEAVNDAADHMCSVCKSKGAMMGCLHKGCSMKYHFVCAIDKDCYMDEENLSLLCPKHKDKRLASTSTGRS